jgi:hypothetical protein
MRRLVLLLIGLMALGLARPVAPVTAMPVHHGHAMPPGHCGDEAPCAAHVCLGCAIDPARPEAPIAIAMAPLPLPQPSPAVRLADHRPGFDPPPPRTLS